MAGLRATKIADVAMDSGHADMAAEDSQANFVALGFDPEAANRLQHSAAGDYCWPMSKGYGAARAEQPGSDARNSLFGLALDRNAPLLRLFAYLVDSPPRKQLPQHYLRQMDDFRADFVDCRLATLR